MQTQSRVLSPNGHGLGRHRRKGRFGNARGIQAQKKMLYGGVARCHSHKNVVRYQGLCFKQTSSHGIEILQKELSHVRESLGMFLYVLNSADHIASVFVLRIQAGNHDDFSTVQQAHQLTDQGACSQVKDQSVSPSRHSLRFPGQETSVMKDGRAVEMGCAKIAVEGRKTVIRDLQVLAFRPQSLSDSHPH